MGLQLVGNNQRKNGPTDIGCVVELSPKWPTDQPSTKESLCATVLIKEQQRRQQRQSQ